MKKAIILIILFALSAPLCPAEDNAAGQETDFEQKMSKKIDDSAQETLSMLEKAGKEAGIKTPMADLVERTTFHDYCFAQTIDEYNKLNTYGVIMVAAQCRDSRELPPKRVYVKSGKKIYNLFLIYSKRSRVVSEISEKVYGKNRMYLYYLLPYAFTTMKGKLYIDFAANRKDFSVCDLPLESNVDYAIGKSNILPEKGRKIDPVALAVFLIREYSFTKQEALAAVKRPGK
jgi:hypothetical protein